MINRIIISNFKGIKNADIMFHQGINILVGNNGVGKSTILEGLSLVLGVGFNQLEITQHLFHTSAIKHFENNKELPEITIEAFLDTSSTSNFNVAQYSGKNHSQAPTYEFGIRLRIFCDEEYKQIFNLSPNEYNHIPCEYYRMERRWFGGDIVKQFLVPFTAYTIDSSSSAFNYRTNNLTNRIIEEELTEQETIEMKGCLRQLKEKFEQNDKVARVNESLNSKITAVARGLKLSVDLTTRSAWNTILAPIYNDIPFSQIGLGDQCVVKTMLSVEQKAGKKKKIMIIEEPESHLSHTKMYELMDNLKGFDGHYLLPPTTVL